MPPLTPEQQAFAEEHSPKNLEGLLLSGCLGKLSE